jgi:hypothetical protein
MRIRIRIFPCPLRWRTGTLKLLSVSNGDHKTPSATPLEPDLYAWDIYRRGGGGLDFGACGSTLDPRRAVRALGSALRGAPTGTRGIVWKVELAPAGTAKYDYGPVIARAERGHECVTWSRKPFR